MPSKEYPLTTMFARIEKAIAPFPKAAMFQLAEQGFTTLYEQLVSCVISIRTLDETTIPVSLKLFALARTPQQMTKLSHNQIADALYGSTFPGQKADTILAITETALQQGGTLPASFETLTAIKGIGPKCANLTLGVSGNIPAISVDIHVHRVTNRWGLIATTSPEHTMEALMEIVPKPQWIDVNRLLMPFGKHLCTGRLPKCSICPVLQWCKQIGVTTHK